MTSFAAANRNHDTSYTTPETQFSWLKPHASFAIVLVGENEIAFGIQKDLLTSTSGYFRQHFFTSPEETIEHIIRLPKLRPEVFALVQHYLFTRDVIPEEELPTFELLIALWQAGKDLDIDGLCEQTIDAMCYVREKSSRIPAAPLIVRVWEETPKGSDIRELLLTWAAEFVHDSDDKSDFVNALPKDVLSELIILMTLLKEQKTSDLYAQKQGYDSQRGHKRARGNSIHMTGATSDVNPRKRRPSLTTSTPRPNMLKKTFVPPSHVYTEPKRRLSGMPKVAPGPDPKVNFCADLLHRMLSGPGFWTRLVKPFKQPVDPLADGVPDYLQKIKKPMDLGSIRAKMERHEYHSADEFSADVRQIFSNCYAYWKETDQIYIDCKKFERTFEDKFSEMPKWIAKLDGADT
ncbi:Bromodomain-containing protein 4A [Ceratocystis fimbriata CBS 114723]|uniref:Bromodomain-containing protein 4A n=2 Tax=Ceratocystis TaxID=5157 RepID=A0A2C5XLN9_9PEZI|nr:Bromodomain-containing protein 4A [Ceratocystis fimbriata CBS 114723]